MDEDQMERLIEALIKLAKIVDSVIANKKEEIISPQEYCGEIIETLEDIRAGRGRVTERDLMDL